MRIADGVAWSCLAWAAAVAPSQQSQPVPQAPVAFEPSSHRTIRGSAHDFANAAWNTNPGGTGAAQRIRPNQLCAVCHLPHVEGRGAVGDGRTSSPLLWGRKTSTATYAMYASATLQGTVDAQPTGSSRLCLSCHDGSVALDLYHLRTSSIANRFVAARSRVPGLPTAGPGIDFAADHPISISYAAGTGAGQDAYLRPVASPFGGTVPGQTIGDVLEGGKVQCASCHDVHNVEVAPDGAHLLRLANHGGGASALCRACHVK